MYGNKFENDIYIMKEWDMKRMYLLLRNEFWKWYYDENEFWYYEIIEYNMEISLKWVLILLWRMWYYSQGMSSVVGKGYERNEFCC